MQVKFKDKLKCSEDILIMEGESLCDSLSLCEMPRQRAISRCMEPCSVCKEFLLTVVHLLISQWLVKIQVPGSNWENSAPVVSLCLTLPSLSSAVSHGCSVRVGLSCGEGWAALCGIQLLLSWANLQGVPALL